jgi:hypothetical protein
MLMVVLISLGVPACAKGHTLRGRLVDEVCYLQDPIANSGDNHPGMASDCATTCAQKGSQVALATDNGTLYEITGGLAANNNAKLIPHIAHTVEIRGDVTKRDGQLMLVADDLKMLHR